MKKLLVLFVVSSLAVVSIAAADEDDGIGLTVGLEFGIGNIGKANEDEMYPYLMPMVIYENSFLDDTLDVYAELDYTFGFTREINGEGDEVLPQSLYLDLMVGYNLFVGEASTLSFILENEFDEFIISPRFEGINALTGIFTPAVQFNQEFGWGDIFAKVSVPITYTQYDTDADAELGLDFTLGWDSSFGLGLEAKILTLLAPTDDAGYLGLETVISYEADTFYCEVETIIPKAVSEEGVSITPEFDYFLGNVTFYVKCEFAGIGVDGADMTVSPALGIKYRF